MDRPVLLSVIPRFARAVDALIAMVAAAQHGAGLVSHVVVQQPATSVLLNLADQQRASRGTAPPLCIKDKNIRLAVIAESRRATCAMAGICALDSVEEPHSLLLITSVKQAR